MKKKMNKKGEALMSKGKSYIVALMVITIIVAVAGIVFQSLSTVGTASTDGIAVPYNITSQNVANGTLLNFTGQFGTIGTIMGVSLIVVVVVFGLIMLFKKGVF